MPLNSKKLHLIDSKELGAHLFYEGCSCKPDMRQYVQSGENIILFFHNQFNEYNDPVYHTYNEDGEIIPDKKESVCS